jgi:hypothetical protein
MLIPLLNDDLFKFDSHAIITSQLTSPRVVHEPMYVCNTFSCVELCDQPSFHHDNLGLRAVSYYILQAGAAQSFPHFCIICKHLAALAIIC